MSPLRQLPRPTGLGVACSLLLLGLVATGQRFAGRDSFLAAIVVATLAVAWLVGLVWPVIAVRLARPAVVSAPTDATAGGHLPVDVRLRGGVTGATSLRVGGLACVLRDRFGGAPSGDDRVLAMSGTTRLRVPTPTRGIAEHVVGWIETDAPLGMFRCRRPIDLALLRPVAIGPVPIAAEVPVVDVPDSGIDRNASHRVDVGDTVRSVRPYRSGDPAHLVHWPTSARTGELVVRELEPPSRPGLVLIVELADESERTEVAVAEAAGMALALVGAGAAVLLCTRERHREVRAEVHRPLDIARRLAAAVPGPVSAPDTTGAPWPVIRVGR